MKRRPLLICVCGPDGAGKSSLVGHVATGLRGLGYAVATQYCYGCVICRRLPSSVRFRFTASARGRRSISSRIGTWVGLLHGWLDATELAARLAEAAVRARLTARGRPSAVVTDRGPLDGLVKFRPAPGSGLATAFIRLLRTYQVALLLDADPKVLAERDSDYALRPLGDGRDGYRHWAARLPYVHVLDATAPPVTVAAEAMGRVLTHQRAPAGAAESTHDAAGEWKHVVISTFDNIRNPHYHGGGALLVEKVARRLAKEYRVTVVTVGQNGGDETRDGVHYRRLPLGWAGPRFGQLLYHALLPLTARRLPHDLWLENFTPPFSTSFLPLFSRSRVVGLAQSLSGGAMSRKYHFPFVLVEGVGLRLYDDVVVLNEADGATVRRRVPHAVTHLISNGVDRPFIAPERIGNGDYIAFLGRVDVWEKGLDLLLSAYSRGQPSMPLLLAGAGAGKEEAKLAGLLSSTGADARWVGEVTGVDKRRFLEGCAFTVLPSRTEAFGIAALESMSYGKPVLHFDLPTLRWMDSGGHVAVPAFDVDALARQLRALAADEQTRRRLGQRAYRAAHRFSWEWTTGEYLTLVRRLLDSPGPPGRTTGAVAREAERREAASWPPIC